MFWCPAPLPAGKAELAVKPPRAVKDKGGQFFLPVPLELLAEVFPSGKGSRWPWTPPTRYLATWSRCPHHTGCPLHHRPKLRVCCPQSWLLLAPWRNTSPTRCPPSPRNVSTCIPRAGAGIGFPPGSGRRVLDVNLLSSLLSFPLSGVSWPRRTRLPLAPRCRACGGRLRRLETPGSSSRIIGCDRNTLTRRPCCLQLICIANSI